jgi:serine/threonine-protein kinase
MEFLDGQTLSRIRARARRVSNVPLSIHLRILAEVLAGLHYVHELTDERGAPLGIVHRDVTPSNVFVTYDGHVKVVDFGIAKATTRIAETRMGVLKGKLAYMSPEAVRGEAVDRRSDIFSVGVMLWEAATGLRLWQDHDEVAVYRRLATGDLPLTPAGAPPVSPFIMRIAQRALAVDPFQRYETAEEMRLEIEDLLVQLGRLTRAPALSAYMESFFAVEREKFQAIVDDALHRFPTKPVSQRRLIANELSDSYPALDPSEPPTTVSTPNGGTFRTTAYDVPLESSEVPDFRPPRRGLALAAVAATFAVGVAGVAHAPANFQTSWLGSMLHGTTATPSPVVAAAKPATLAPSPVVAAANPPTVAPSPVATPPTALSAPSAEEPGKPSAPGSATPAHNMPPGQPGSPESARLGAAQNTATRPGMMAPKASAPMTARTARSVEPREELPKAKRGKRSLDRDDPWAP